MYLMQGLANNYFVNAQLQMRGTRCSASCHPGYRVLSALYFVVALYPRCGLWLCGMYSSAAPLVPFCKMTSLVTSRKRGHQQHLVRSKSMARMNRRRHSLDEGYLQVCLWCQHNVHVQMARRLWRVENKRMQIGLIFITSWPTRTSDRRNYETFDQRQRLQRHYPSSRVCYRISEPEQFDHGSLPGSRAVDGDSPWLFAPVNRLLAADSGSLRSTLTGTCTGACLPHQRQALE